MPDRPIIFSAPETAALLDGRKTQTRRVLGKTGRFNIFAPGEWSDEYVMDPGNADWRARCTPYKKDDRFWVREAWMYARYRMDNSEPVPEFGALYRADGCYEGLRGWRSPILMPRQFSRLTLTVTDVRVQRLQEISEEDAIAEGCAWSDAWEGFTPCPGPCDARFFHGRYASRSFEQLWDGIHGDDSWDANPWVAAITFTVRRGNIDAP